MEKTDIIYRPQIIYNATSPAFVLNIKPTKDVSFEKGRNPMFSQTFPDVIYLCAKKLLLKGTKLK